MTLTKPIIEKTPTVKAVADATRQLADGRLPIKLRVTYIRERKYWTINGMDKQPLSIASQAEFEQLMNSVHRNKTKKELQEHIQTIEAEARKIVSSLPEFSFEAFKARFKGETTQPEDLFAALEQRQKALVIEGRISTATAFSCTLNSLRKFASNKQMLPFQEITPDWLKKYEHWMIEQGNNLTTTGIYLRNVRTLFNEEVAAGRIPSSAYPFSKNRYQIPTGSNVKKALTIEQVRMIAGFQPRTDSEGFYRDLWLFSYFGNGMNPKDICNLRFKDITTDAISFIRAKTQRTKKQKMVTVPILPQLQAIIDKWANQSRKPDNYVFPILSLGNTPEQEYKRIQQTVKSINHYIGKIAESLGIEANITTYVARHSFATVLKRSGVSIEFISESLGHSDLKTTENYLANFELDKKLEIAQNLI